MPEPIAISSRVPAPTPRLAFRCWTLADHDLAHELGGDPQVTQYIGGPWSAAQIDARLATEIANAEKLQIQYWPCFDRQTDVLVGAIGLREWEPGTSDRELGFHLRPTYWGQGLAVEGSRTVIAYARDVLRLSSLNAGHHPEHAATRHILLKLGFERCGECFYPPTGLMHPVYRLEFMQPQLSADLMA